MDSTVSTATSRKTKTLVIHALFITLTLVATMFINIRLPIMGNGGLIHLGNVPLLIAAFVYGKKAGAIAGAFGMAFFDIISGWAAWAPFTFIIVGAMGYLAGLIAEKIPGKRVLVYALAVAVALIIKVVGYYFTEVILYSNWILPFGSIPGNVMQVLIAGIIVIPIAGRLKDIIGRI
ncbi:ECF transporter S component [Bacillus thermotolerans]|uniref:Pyridoxin-related ECF transporter n=1 Tax=Bacillus thermotolerans TaxID=1221996 RepID=A0A0F5I3F0_BACTR|nr:ECF transporter S component [Bacillus thermotolerans]KKB40003.1 putative pyridoxin-related ECF transporter [Bacillus thermotolerans]